jgi:hypothetical protein
MCKGLRERLRRGVARHFATAGVAEQGPPQPVVLLPIRQFDRVPAINHRQILAHTK